jgi:hypothetical protein
MHLSGYKKRLEKWIELMELYIENEGRSFEHLIKYIVKKYIFLFLLQ